MAHKLSDLRAKQKALKAESDVIIAAAEAAGGEYTSAQDTRLTVLRGEVAALDTEIDAAIVALEPPPPPVNPAPTAGDVDTERKRAGDILAACKMVGKDAKAAEFIASGKTLSEVVATLQAERATASEATDVRPGNPGADRQKAAVGWDKAVSRVNKRNGFK